MESNTNLMLKADDCEIFGWIFDYAAWMAWDEFQQNHTVDSRTERSFMTGVMEYTPGIDQERIHRVEFIHLLCLLADGEKTNLSYTKGDEEHRTPLEIALDNVDKLEASLEKKSPVRKSMAEMRRLIKIQAVLALLRAGEKQASKDLLAAFWPKQIKRSAEDKEAVSSLTEMVSGKKNKTFDAAHSHDKFCQALIPTLRQIHDQFKKPFLTEIMAKKKDIQKHGPAKPKQVSYSQLKKVGEARASTSQGESSSSSRSSPRRGRTLTASSTSEEESSPRKRGRSIRSLKYGQGSRTTKRHTKTTSEKVEWDSIMDSDEDDEDDALRTRINGNESINTPKVDSTLGEVPGTKLRHRKIPKTNPSPSKRRPWSSEEEEQLKLGINRFGVGKWAEINMAYTFNNRTNVQLKDKYRTMVNQGLLSN